MAEDKLKLPKIWMDNKASRLAAQEAIDEQIEKGGGGGAPVLTRAEWDALTTEEKQSYGLVSIQERGIYC